MISATYIFGTEEGKEERETFDITPGFERASADVLKEAWRGDWYVCEAVDTLCALSLPVYPALAERVRLARAHNQGVAERGEASSQLRDISCVIDEEEAMAWLKEHRHDLWEWMIGEES